MGQLNGITLPAPTRGVTFFQPKAKQDANFCDWSVNFIHEADKSRVREGIKIHSFSTAISTPLISGLGVYRSASTEKILGFAHTGANAQVIDFTTFDTVTEKTFSNITGYNYTGNIDLFTLNYKRNLFIFAPSNVANQQGVRYDGSTYTNISFNHSIAPVGGCVYGNRIYLIGSQSTDLVYAGVNSISGDTSTFALDKVYSDGARNSWIAPFSYSNGSVNADYLLICNEVGEILVYSGENPDSISWRLERRFRIPPPAYKDGYIGNFYQTIEVGNDLFVLTSAGVVSIKALFSGDNNFTISKEIDIYWVNLIKAIRNAGDNPYISGVYQKTKNRVVILLNGILSENGGYSESENTIFIYDLNTGGWSIQQTQSFQGLTFTGLKIANEKLFAIMQSISGRYYCLEVLKEETFLDFDGENSHHAFLYTLKSSWNNFGDVASNKQVQGFQPIIYNDFANSTAQYGMKVSVDMGRATSGLVEVPAPNDGFTKKSYSLGAEGTFIQWQIEGFTTSTGSPTRGLELYAVNALFERGNIGL